MRIRIDLKDWLFADSLSYALTKEGWEVVTESEDIRILEFDSAESSPSSVVLVPHVFNKRLLCEHVKRGCRCFVSEDGRLDELKTAVKAAFAGEQSCSHQVMDQVFDQLAILSKHFKTLNKCDTFLSERELDVLKWVAEGLSNKQIAGRLHLSIYTVKNHVHNAIRKTGTDNRRQATAFAIRQGWLTPISD